MRSHPQFGVTWLKAKRSWGHSVSSKLVTRGGRNAVTAVTVGRQRSGKAQGCAVLVVFNIMAAYPSWYGANYGFVRPGNRRTYNSASTSQASL